MRARTFEELGKSSLTVSVAWIVFGVIQPIFSDKFTLKFSIIASVGFLLFGTLGIILLERSAYGKE